MYCHYSTISSNLNAISAVTLEDFVRKRRINMTDKAATITSRCLAVGYGILIIVLSFGFAQIHTSQLIMASVSVLAATGGPLLGVFTLGMMSRKATNKGALVGLAAGLFLTSWITIGAEIFPNPDWKQLSSSTSKCSTNASLIASHSCAVNAASVPDYDRARKLYGISFMWYGLIGFLATYFIGYLMSLVLPERKMPVDKNLLVMFGQRKWSLCCKSSQHNSEVQYIEMDNQMEVSNKSFNCKIVPYVIEAYFSVDICNVN
jgi:Na+/proline symporter